MVLTALNQMLQIRDSILIQSDTDSNPDRETAKLASKRRIKKFSCFEQFGALVKRMEASLGAYKIIEKTLLFCHF
jgi:hypothetical protein